MKIGYEQTKMAVDEMNERYPRPGLKLALEPLTPINTTGMWQNADKQGVYFFFDSSETLQYIGKASLDSTIGKRVGNRFASGDRRCLDEKFSSVSLLATVALPTGRAFEAPSIEEYLIVRLRPPLNAVGIRDN